MQDSDQHPTAQEQDQQKSLESSQEALPGPDDQAPHFFVVGIGASAGGLEPLQLFFDHLSAQANTAYVVIQHLSPDYKSLMKELLARHTHMQLHRVEDGMKLEGNSVYLIPPKKNMVVEGDRLRLIDQSEEPAHKPHYPIDIFFDSLAQHYGECAIGVVLSGTGSDGTRGIQAINEAGGVVMVQDPQTAQFNGMPLSSIQTGMAHCILSPEDLAKEVYKYVNRFAPQPGLPLGEKRAPIRDLNRIFEILKKEEGIDFFNYKESTISRRIQRRVMLSGAGELSDYIAILEQSAEERHHLRKDLLISVTSFFRDPQAWNYIQEHVLPQLIDRVPESESLRIWVTACATGEEVYTLAMLITEYLDQHNKALDVNIFATDIDQQALERAAAGQYPESIAAEVSKERLNRFFTRNGNRYVINRSLREMIIFAPHDLNKDSPFTRMHLVICRNVLIYMNQKLQNHILSMLHFSLRVGGFLFLGAAETTGILENEFKTVQRLWKIFEKKRDTRLPLSRHHLPQQGYDFQPIFNGRHENYREQNKVNTLVTDTFGSYLKRRSATCLVIGSQNELLHAFGKTEAYLRVPEGRTTLDVTKILPKELSLPLHTGLHRVRKEKTATSYHNLKIPGEGNVAFVDLSIIYYNGEKVPENTCMIVIEPSSQAETTPTTIKETDVPAQAAQRINDLEYELQQTRENLQATIEELETSNEEQQATNEELLASNEELQSTNEELHSVNEELHTVNSEYQAKIQELMDLNNDIDNLLISTDIGTVFLDEELRIRKFTPPVTAVINLLEQDLGRPIDHISNNISMPSLAGLAQEVFDTGQAKEKEVRNHQGIDLLMRINPYIGNNQHIKGVVLTFVNISELTAAQDDLRQARESLEKRTVELEKANINLSRLAAIVESSSDAIISKDLDGLITSWNPGAEKLYGYTAEEAIGRPVSFLVPPDHADEVPRFLNEIRQGKHIHLHETVRQNKAGRLIDVTLSISPLHDGHGQVIGASSIAQNITERKKAEQEIKQLAMAVRASGDAVILFDFDGRIHSWNPGAQALYGYSQDEAMAMSIFDLIPEEQREAARAIHERVIHGEKGCSFETQRRHKDGTLIDVWLSMNLLTDEKGQLLGIATSERDITQRKQDREDLANLTRRYSSILDSAGEGIFGIDAERRATFINQAAVEMTGWKPEEIIGQYHHYLIHHDGKDQANCMQNECPARTCMQHKQRMLVKDDSFIRKDGTIFPVEYVCSPILDESEQAIGAVVIFRDVTEQKRHLGLIEHQNQFMNNVFEAISQPLYVLDAKTRQIVSANTAARSASEAGLMNCYALRGMDQPCDEAGLPCPLKITCETRQPTMVEHVNTDAEGNMHHWEVHAYPLCDANGEVAQVIEYCLDITDRKEAEQAIKKVNDELQQKNAEIEQFVYTVSHDLRSPLVTIQGFSSALKQELDAKGETNLLDNLDRILNAGNRMSRLIEDLLTFNRIGRTAAPTEMVALSKVMEEILGYHEQEIHDKKIHIQVDQDLPALRINREHAIRIFDNLISNAIKYGSTHKKPEIHIGCQRENGQIQFYVRDNGDGIPEPYQDQIFELFQRLSNNIPGTGLGLAIVRKMVGIYHGTTWAESADGRGTTMWVAWPAKELIG